MSNNHSSKRVTVQLPVEYIANLSKFAAKRDTNFSEEVRKAIAKYINIESTADDINFIREQLREELRAELGASTDRLAKLIVKSGILSGSAFHLTSALFNQKDTDKFRETMREARAQGIVEMSRRSGDTGKAGETDV